MIIAEKLINGISVSINGVESEEGVWYMSFTVSNEYVIRHIPKKDKIAITRWLLSEWERIKTNYRTIIGSVEMDDDFDYRKAIYLKLGFRDWDGFNIVLYGEDID